eukprot:5744968-Prymnesium_polylepis.1
MGADPLTKLPLSLILPAPNTAASHAYIHTYYLCPNTQVQVDPWAAPKALCVVQWFVHSAGTSKRTPKPAS